MKQSRWIPVSQSNLVKNQLNKCCEASEQSKLSTWLVSPFPQCSASSQPSFSSSSSTASTGIPCPNIWVVELSPSSRRWSVWRIGYESADHLTPLPGQWTGRGELPTILIYRFLFQSLCPFYSCSSLFLTVVNVNWKAFVVVTNLIIDLSWPRLQCEYR